MVRLGDNLFIWCIYYNNMITERRFKFHGNCRVSTLIPLEQRAIIIIWALGECELGGGAHTINPPPPFSPPYLASMWEHQDYKNYRNSLMAHTLYYHNYIEEL